MSRGFSLIETIVYVALLGFMMSGAVITAYQVTQSSFVVNEKDTVQEEGNFVLRKLEHAFVGAADVWASGSSLVIDTYPIGGSVMIVGLDGAGDLYLDRNASLTDDDKLTTDNVTADFEFTVHAGSPKGVTATTTIDGVDFVITKYVR